MKLFKLTRHDGGYDECEGFVIRAESEQAARALAAKSRADEAETEWTDPTKSDCDEVAVDGPERIILTDFHAG